MQKSENDILYEKILRDVDRYISGITGKKYLLIDDFKHHKIKLEFQNFQHPIYQQVFDPFYPNMAIIDLLFNEGNNAMNIIKKEMIWDDRKMYELFFGGEEPFWNMLN